MQQQLKDPAIKLFGRTIPLTLADLDGSVISVEDSVNCGGGDLEEMICSDFVRSSSIAVSFDGDEVKLKFSEVNGGSEKDIVAGNLSPQEDVSQPSKQDSTTNEICTETNENPENPSIDEEKDQNETTDLEEKDQNETTDLEEKELKRPDKILPCPRCKSMDTKFCYYNNYNVHQPRHFCKSCQRYWTSGGTMRNVPVGAGRRKNKNVASSRFHHITISEALQSASTESLNVSHVHHPSLSYNNGKDQVENSNNRSTESSVTVTHSTEEMVKNYTQNPLYMPNFNGFSPHLQCLPGFHWPYPWNTQASPPTFFHPGMPMPFYPATCMNAPWTTCPTNNNSQNFAPNSSNLGKHSREECQVPQKQENLERSIWVPKTLRFDDPEEAAKSSIWKTLGIKNNTISKGGIFKAFQPKSVEKNNVPQSAEVLRANPAALSRSVNFHETL